MGKWLDSNKVKKNNSVADKMKEVAVDDDNDDNDVDGCS